MTLIRTRLLAILTEAIQPLIGSTDEAGTTAFTIELDLPKQPEHGDYATNAAMLLARRLRQNPRQVADRIVAGLHDPDQILARVEIAGPGFINFFVKPSGWHRVLTEILAERADYGRRNLGGGRRVQVEFVSANPTGPLHIGHGRGSATGDVLANILAACGYQVEREYYINDAGNQMETLGRSLYHRYLQLLGDPTPFPENHYQGEYMIELAQAFRAEHGDRLKDLPLAEVLPLCTRYAGGKILEGIRNDLADFGVSFDVWFSEQSLHDRNAIAETIADLERRGFIYTADGAKWFKTTDFGDEKDRVVVRANGVSTYFAADLAYHKNKFDRGFDRVIDIWGADHHGYVPRMSAGAQALGRAQGDLQIVLVQLVNLLRAGTPVAMSTRAGEFVTLREVIDEVGTDAARFIFLTRRSDSQLDFDLEVAKARGNDNPVYYVQYAHARLSSLFEVARERGPAPPAADLDRFAPLTAPEEIQLIKLLGEYPEVLANSALHLEPHRITYYLHQLVAEFHSYYNRYRILGEDEALTEARLGLAEALRVVIHNGLQLLGVTAPEKM